MRREELSRAMVVAPPHRPPTVSASSHRTVLLSRGASAGGCRGFCERRGSRYQILHGDLGNTRRWARPVERNDRHGSNLSQSFLFDVRTLYLSQNFSPPSPRPSQSSLSVKGVEFESFGETSNRSNTAPSACSQFNLKLLKLGLPG